MFDSIKREASIRIGNPALQRYGVTECSPKVGNLINRLHDIPLPWLRLALRVKEAIGETRR